MMPRRLREKFDAFSSCWRFSRAGADRQSRRLLLYVGIMAKIYPARRKRLFNHIQAFIARAAAEGLVEVTLRIVPGRRRSGAVRIVFRAGDRADYQTMWECLSDEIYPLPKHLEIRYLLDGGANLGLFSVWQSRRPLKHILAVEPDSGNLQLLRRNTASLPMLEVVPAALSDRDGEAVFEAAESNTGHLRGAPGHPATARAATVRCRRLVDLLPPEWEMDYTWVKLDIEGAEYDVLRDMLHAGRLPAVLSIEIHDYLGSDGQGLVGELEAVGYEVEVPDPGNERNTCRQVTAVRNMVQGTLVGVIACASS